MDEDEAKAEENEEDEERPGFRARLGRRECRLGQDCGAADGRTLSLVVWSTGMLIHRISLDMSAGDSFEARFFGCYDVATLSSSFLLHSRYALSPCIARLLF